MAEITLVADMSREVGSRPSRRLRTEGKVPGVLYGHGVEPVSLAVDARELRHALSTQAGANALFSLEVAGTKHLAMAKQIQRHPVRGTLSHVDFLVVSRHERMTVDVPVTLVGEATEVIQARGVVDQETFSLSLSAPADSIPSSIDVDVSGLAVGDSIRLEDVKLPKGVEAQAAGDLVLVVGQPPQVTDLPTAEEGGETEGDEESAGEAEAEAGEESQGD